MRYVLAIPVLLLVMAVDASSSAHAAKWCARYGDGSTNCGFPTRWACQQSVSGVGGFCAINPRWRDRGPRRRPY